MLLQFLVLLPQLARAALKHFNNPFAGAVALPVRVSAVVVQCCIPCERKRRGILDITAFYCCSFSLCQSVQLSRMSVCLCICLAFL